MWLILCLLAATSLSSFLWLPYTGVPLPLPQLVIVSIVSGVCCLMVFLIAWRHSNRV